jgi:hypothetical protein
MTDESVTAAIDLDYALMDARRSNPTTVAHVLVRALETLARGFGEWPDPTERVGAERVARAVLGLDGIVIDPTNEGEG